MSDSTPQPGKTPGETPPASGEKTPASRIDRTVSDLAARSTGLNRPEPAAGDTPRERSAGWRLAGLGIEFAGSTLVFVLIGLWLDRRYGWGNTATLTLAGIAVVGNLYLIIKEALKLNK